MLTRIFAAAVLLGILTATEPARAATIDDVNIIFSNGWNLTGEVGFNPIGSGYAYPYAGPAGLFLNGAKWGTGSGAPNGSGLNGIWGFNPSTGFCCAGTLYLADVEFNLADVPYLVPHDFSIYTTSPYYSGTPDAIGVSGTVSPVPLPPALPLFGSGIAALAGFAVRRRGKVSA